MSNKLTITIELPDGVVPDVNYSSAPTVPDAAPPIVQEVAAPEFPPFPRGMEADVAPSCRIHHRAMKPARGGGWMCTALLGTTQDGRKQWCSETA